MDIVRQSLRHMKIYYITGIVSGRNHHTNNKKKFQLIFVIMNDAGPLGFHAVKFHYIYGTAVQL